MEWNGRGWCAAIRENYQSNHTLSTLSLFRRDPRIAEQQKNQHSGKDRRSRDTVVIVQDIFVVQWLVGWLWSVSTGIILLSSSRSRSTLSWSNTKSVVGSSDKDAARDLQEGHGKGWMGTHFNIMNEQGWGRVYKASDGVTLNKQINWSKLKDHNSNSDKSNCSRIGGTF